MEAAPAGDFRVAKPNRDHQEIHHRVGRVLVPEVGDREHVKEANIRDIPYATDVLRAVYGLNSSKTAVFRTVFDSITYLE